MNTNSSSTEIFYHWLDLNQDEQAQLLQQLATSQPEVYQQLLPLFSEAGHDKLNTLLGFHVRHAAQDSLELSGQNIDKFKLGAELGRGGMGVVYAAHRADDTFEQELAIKFIQPNLTNILGKRALFEEAQLLARLNHPYIAKVFDGGMHDEMVYIVMEQVSGTTLERYLEQYTPTQNNKLKLFIKVCRAIEHAHQNQVLHADLKPENILIDGEQQPKVLDFNLTQRVQRSREERNCMLVAFSDQYASPEQKAGRYLTQQSDVYSLGNILALMVGKQNKGSDLSCVIRRATKTSLKHRYASVAELRQDIEHILACRPIAEKSHLLAHSALRLLQRRPLQSSLLGLLLAAIAVFNSTLVQKNAQLAREKRIAEEMMFEVTSMMFHAKDSKNNQLSVDTMLELTRRRILSNPAIPQHIKQKMLLAMITPIPAKSTLNQNCAQAEACQPTRIRPQSL